MCLTLVISFDLHNNPLKMWSGLSSSRPTDVRAEVQSSQMRSCRSSSIRVPWQSQMEITGQVGHQGIRMALGRMGNGEDPFPDTKGPCEWASVGPLSWTLPSMLMVHYQGKDLSLTSQHWGLITTTTAKFAKLPLGVVETAYVKHVAWPAEGAGLLIAAIMVITVLTSETCTLPSRVVQPGPVWGKIAKQVWSFQGRGLFGALRPHSCDYGPSTAAPCPALITSKATAGTGLLKQGVKSLRERRLVYKLLKVLYGLESG